MLVAGGRSPQKGWADGSTLRGWETRVSLWRAIRPVDDGLTAQHCSPKPGDLAAPIGRRLTTHAPAYQTTTVALVAAAPGRVPRWSR